MNKIITNKIQCKHCGEIIESKSEHDFKMCMCRKVGVDGGKQYLRRLGYPDDIIELSVVEQAFTVEITETLQKQIVVRATSKEEAKEMARDLYCEGKEVLYAEDLKETTFKVVEE